jgi:hypothetical protein
MPNQTTKGTSFIRFGDGCKVEIKASGDVSYTDLGIIKGDTTAVFNYDIREFISGNKGTPIKDIKNMTIAATFDLADLDPIGTEKLSNGVIEKVDTAASPIATIPNQVISAGWDGDTVYPIIMQTSSSDSTEISTTAKPSVTITLDLGGTPEVLTEATGKINIFADTGSVSGWSLSIQEEILVTGSPTTFDITLVYGSNTPIASSTLHMGTTSKTLNEYALRMTRTDSAGKTIVTDLHSAVTDSGSLSFGFLGQNASDVDGMTLSITGDLDETLTDGRQLLSQTIQSGFA